MTENIEQNTACIVDIHIDIALSFMNGTLSQLNLDWRLDTRADYCRQSQIN